MVVPCLVFEGEKLVALHLDIICCFKAMASMCHRVERVKIGWRKVQAVCGMPQKFNRIKLSDLWCVCLAVCSEVWSSCSRACFLSTKAGYFHLNSRNIQSSWAAYRSVLTVRLFGMSPNVGFPLHKCRLSTSQIFLAISVALKSCFQVMT